MEESTKEQQEKFKKLEALAKEANEKIQKIMDMNIPVNDKNGILTYINLKFIYDSSEGQEIVFTNNGEQILRGFLKYQLEHLYNKFKIEGFRDLIEDAKPLL